jgi:hypothetical protein
MIRSCAVLGLLLATASPANATPVSKTAQDRSSETFATWIRKQLPEKLRGLTPGKTTAKVAEASLGSAAERPSPEISYYVSAGVRFDTTLIWKKGTLESFTFVWPRSPGNLPSLERWISKERVQAAFKDLEKEVLTGRDPEGRTIVIPLPEEGITLEFSSIGDRPLQKATFSLPAAKKSVSTKGGKP